MDCPAQQNGQDLIISKRLKSFVELIKALVKAISDAVKWISGVFGEVDRAKNSGFVQGNIWQGVKESYYYANDLVNKGLKNVGDLLFPSAKAATTNAVLNNIIGTESNWNNSKINKKIWCHWIRTNPSFYCEIIWI